MNIPQKINRDIIFAVSILIVLQALLSIKAGVYKGVLGDTDVYMWLHRVLELHSHGDWSDHSLSRVNPPDGYEQHWTRPYDLMLYVGAWLGSHVIDFRTALHIWAVMISPILEIVALLSFIWAIHPLTKGRENGIAGLLFVTQMGIIASFVAGRADHQSLILLLFILTLGLALRLLLERFCMRTCFLTALVSAIAIWVSVEAIILPFILMALFGFLWTLGHERLLRIAANYAAMLWAMLLIFRLVEFGPSRFFEPAPDQISIIYITLFGLAALYWLLMTGITIAINQSTKSFKISSAVIWTCFSIILLIILFPGISEGPWNQMDALFREMHHAKTKELQPPLSITALTDGNAIMAIAKFALWIGIIVPGIPVILYKIRHSGEIERLGWSLLGASSLVYVPLALSQLRWAPYVAIIMLPGYLVLITWLIKTAGDHFKDSSAGIARVSILVFSVIIFALPTVLYDKKKDEGDQRISSCPLIPVSAFLSSPEVTANNTSLNLLAFTDFGPELIYRTPHKVFSIPSHRPHPGFNDSFAIMTSSTPTEAKALAMAKNVDYILICPRGHENHFYVRNDSKPTLFSQLAAGIIPTWLEPVSLPVSARKDFLLFRVMPNAVTQLP